MSKESEETRKRAAKPKGKGGKPGQSQQPGAHEVKNRKLYFVICCEGSRFATWSTSMLLMIGVALIVTWKVLVMIVRRILK